MLPVVSMATSMSSGAVLDCADAPGATARASASTAAAAQVLIGPSVGTRRSGRNGLVSGLRREDGAGISLTEFSLETERKDGTLYLRPRGDFDLIAAWQVEKALRDVEPRDTSAIIVDLRGLSFIDSTGLQTLTRGAQRARDQNIAFTIVRAPAKMDRVFELTGTYEGVDLVDSLPGE
jgi:anti-sigma B factor antagonist